MGARLVRLGVVGVVLVAGAARAQTDTSWLVGVDGLWNDAANWSNGVPDNGGLTFNAIIGVPGVAGEYVVTLDIDATVDGLEMTSEDATLDGQGGAFGLDVLQSVLLSDARLAALSGMTSQGMLTFDSQLCDELCDIPISHTGTGVVWQGLGGIDLLGSTTFTHGAGSTFTITSDATMQLDAPATFRNEGTLLKTSGGITTLDGALGGVFENPGTVDVGAGVLATDALDVPGGTLAEGAWIVRDGTTLDLVGATIMQNAAAVTLSGPGSQFPAFDPIVINEPAGSISILDGRSFVTQGPFDNLGTLLVGAGSSFELPPGLPLMNIGLLRGGGTIGAPVGNAGTTAPGASPGILTIVSPDQGFMQFPEGAVEIEIGGFEPGFEFDVLAIKGILAFDGGKAGTLEIQLIDGFVPNPGDTFEVITCQDLPLGQFAEVVAPNLPCSLDVVVNYGPGQVVVVFVENCVGDCNDDMELDILDFVCFQNEWVNQTPCGDCDGNGEFNILDFVCFQSAWVQGCP